MSDNIGIYRRRTFLLLRLLCCVQDKSASYCSQAIRARDERERVFPRARSPPLSHALLSPRRDRDYQVGPTLSGSTCCGCRARRDECVGMCFGASIFFCFLLQHSFILKFFKNFLVN